MRTITRSRAAALIVLGLLPATASLTGLAGPAAAQGTPAPAPPIDCAEVAAQISSAPAERRVDLALAALDGGCQPLPAPIAAAMKDGHWADRSGLADAERIALVSRAIRGRYAEAETLAVAALEVGSWPDGHGLNLESGANLVRALSPALTAYRVHLLMDIYEQIPDGIVRQGILQTLRASSLPEALLPALDASYNERGPVQEAAFSTLSEQGEQNPDEILARLIRVLPEGPMLNWAVRLGNQNSSGPVAAAKKERGLTN